MKHLDRIANIAVILGIVVFLTLVTRNEIRSTVPHQKLLGKSITLPEIRFPLQRGAILLALSTTCHFCQEGLPFYKQLPELLHGKLEIIAVFPQEANEARSYVERSSLRVDRIISTDLGPIGVSATPTVLLIDRMGRVQGVWTGVLSQRHGNS